MKKESHNSGTRMRPRRLNLRSTLIRFKARPAGFGILLACALIGLCSCRGTVDLAPTDVADNDTCTYCKMAIEQVQYAAEFITKDGFARKFDDIGCMVRHAEKIQKANIAAFYVMDYTSKQWVKGEEAQFVQAETIQTPMNSGLIAFKDRSTAEAVASEYGGKVVGLDDIVK